MASKTWRIGEYANYGIWQAVVEKDKVRLIGKDWDTKKVEEEIEVPLPNKKAQALYDMGVFSSHVPIYRQVLNELEQYMSYHYADEIATWVEEKTGG